MCRVCRLTPFFSHLSVSHGGGSLQEGGEEGEAAEGNDTVLPEQVRADGRRERRLCGRFYGKRPISVSAISDEIRDNPADYALPCLSDHVGGLCVHGGVGELREHLRRAGPGELSGVARPEEAGPRDPRDRRLVSETTPFGVLSSPSRRGFPTTDIGRTSTYPRCL